MSYKADGEGHPLTLPRVENGKELLLKKYTRRGPFIQDFHLKNKTKTNKQTNNPSNFKREMYHLVYVLLDLVG